MTRKLFILIVLVCAVPLGCVMQRSFQELRLVRPPAIPVAFGGGDEPMVTVVDSMASSIILPIPNKPPTYSNTFFWDALPGAVGYQVGIGTNSGSYTRILDCGSYRVATITGLLFTATYYLATRGYSAFSTSAWSKEFVWPWPRTNWVEIPPDCVTAAAPNSKQWLPSPTNRFYGRLGTNVFFRSIGTNPIWIRATNNLDRYRHRE